VGPSVYRKFHRYMLIVVIGHDLERHRPAIQFNTYHRGTQADRRQELDPAVSSAGAPGIQHDAVGGLFITEVESGRPNADVTNCEGSPVGRHMRRQGDLLLFRIGLKSEHSSEDGADYHRGGPNLVWRTRRKRLVIIAGQHFRKVPECAVNSK